MKKSETWDKTRTILDLNLDQLRKIEWPSMQKGWVKTIRSALRMTEGELAAKMGVNQATLHKLEKSEVAGRIQLVTLRKAAQALNCEVVYALAPKQNLQNEFFKRAIEIAREELPHVSKTMQLENQMISDTAGLEEWLAKKIIEEDRVRW